MTVIEKKNILNEILFTSGHNVQRIVKLLAFQESMLILDGKILLVLES